MRVIIQSDYQKMSQWAANHVIECINRFNPTPDHKFVLGLPTGSSPVGMYNALVEANRAGKVSFKNVLTFNMASRGVERHRKEIRRPGRVRWYSYMRYATNRLAVRRARVEAAGICFSEHFGGGCRYGSGEDTIFLHDCLKRGLKIYAVPICLGETDDTSSTWFGGYDEKFFFDKGALFGAIYGGPGIIFCAAFVLRHRVFFQGNQPLKRTHAFARMCMGIREYLAEHREREGKKA